jgi:5'-AMP-activated protein kinase regulatory gamma subunit
LQPTPQPGNNHQIPASVTDVVQEGKRMISEFLSQHTCYDLLGKSAKVVVFDVNITIRLAYYVLVEHSIGAAPLWDPVAQSIVGMITVTDFVEVLRHGYESKTIRQVIDSHTVGSWRSLIAQVRSVWLG